jgi:pimeloyl-ACP methyl ester carboxylesterase
VAGSSRRDPATEVSVEAGVSGWSRYVGRFAGQPFNARLRVRGDEPDLLSMLATKDVADDTSLEDATLALAALGAPSESRLTCTYLSNGAHVHDYAADARLPTVVLLHALAGNVHNWLPVTTSLRGRARLVLVDLPGHGRSASRLPGPPERLSEQVVDWLDEVLAAMEVRECLMVGHSLGGRVATYYAAHGSCDVSRLVLVAPALRPSLSGVRGIAARAATLMTMVRRRRGARWIAGLVFFDMLIAHTHHNRRLVGYALEDMLQDQDRQGYSGIRLALAWLRSRPDDSDIDYADLTARTAVTALFGEEDKYCPMSRHPELHLQGVQVREVRETGHLLPLEAPHVLLEELGLQA